MPSVLYGYDALKNLKILEPLLSHYVVAASSFTCYYYYLLIIIFFRSLTIPSFRTMHFSIQRTILRDSDLSLQVILMFMFSVFTASKMRTKPHYWDSRNTPGVSSAAPGDSGTGCTGVDPCFFSLSALCSTVSGLEKMFTEAFGGGGDKHLPVY